MIGSQLSTMKNPIDKTTWTLCVIPDTQRLAANNPTAYNTMMQWIVDNATTEDIRMVMHVGDYCNLGSSSTEWSRTDTAVNRLHGNVPFIHCAGNHDYDDDAKGTYSRKTTNWEAVFPYTDWTSYDWYIGSYENITTNMAATLQIGQYSYLFLTSEFWARQDAMDWAQTQIDDNPTDRVIWITHALTAPDGNFETDASDGTVGGQAGVPQFYGVCNFSTDADCKTGVELRDEFLKVNENIILACCGHDVAGSDVPAGQGTVGQTAYSKTTVTTYGNTINTHLFNYQNASANTYANSAYLRLYKFDHSDNTCDVTTYNPVQDTNLTDAQNQFTFTYK